MRVEAKHRKGMMSAVSAPYKFLEKQTTFLLIFALLFGMLTPAFAEEVGSPPPYEVSNDSNAGVGDLGAAVNEGDDTQDPSTIVQPGDAEQTDDSNENPDFFNEGVAQEEVSALGSATVTPEPGAVQPAQRPTAKQAIPEPDPTTGALTYRYPLTVPPGRNGLAPELALIYNSQDPSRSSYLGDRWSLNIPYIERLNKTGTDKLYIDNYFTSSLSGELVLVSSTTYAPKVENGDFLRYNYDGTSWIVTDKAGTVYKFGALAASRQDDPGDATKVYRWMLAEVRDTNNNFVDYSYYKDGGQIYPDTITYTGNGATPGIFKIAFGRGDYDSASPSLYYPSFKVKTGYRITSIVASVNDEWVRRYDMGYAAGDQGYRVLLSSVTESGRDLDTGTVTTLPAATFAYKTHGTMGWDHQGSAWQLPEWFLNRTEITMIQIADVNGDTYPDVAYADSGTNVSPERVSISNTLNGWNANDANWTFPIWIKNGTGYKDNGTRIFDVNGDLLNDVVRSLSPHCGDPASASTVYLNSGNPVTGWVQTNSIAVPIGFVFNGNLYADGAVRPFDVNGDGLTDLIWAKLDDDVPGLLQRVYLGTGSGWTEAAPGTWQVPFGFRDDHGADINTFAQVADVNGDGLPDILWRFNESHYWWPDRNADANYTFINNGHGWEPNDPELRRIPMPFQGTKYLSVGRTDLGVRATDLNGDGIPDMMYSRSSGGSFDSYGYLNSGRETTFPYVSLNPANAPEAIVISGDSTNTRVQLADVNADGLDDFLYSERRSTDYVSVKRTHLAKPNSFTDLLISATAPSGGTYAVTYKLSNQYRNADSSLMNPHLPLVIPTVQQITVTDPVRSVTATSMWSYQDGSYYYASPTDRRFAGFGVITKTDPAGNVTKTYYHQGNETNSAQGEYSDDASKIGRPYRVEQYDGAGHLYALTVSKWDKSDLGTGRSFVKLASTMALAYDGNGTHRDTATEYAYDNTYGNVIQKTVWGEVSANADGSFIDVGSDKSTEVISYSANVASYLVGLPAVGVVIDQFGEKVRETRTYYDTLPLGSAGRGNPTKTEHWVAGSNYVASQKAYDAFYGLVASVTDQRGKATSYVYDAYNLYPATVTDPLAHSTQYLYDYSSGQLKQVADQNGFVHGTAYDGLDRVVAEMQPDQTTPTMLATKTEYVYTDTSAAVKVRRTDYLDNSISVDTYQYFDGFGRLVQERKEAEASGAFNVRDTFYNSLGLKQKESLPYMASGAGRTAATTTAAFYINYSYDPLGRPLTVANSLGTSMYAYDDWKTTVTDPNGKLKRYYKDAFGNLAGVDEVNSGSTYVTQYAWNLNGSLTRITDALGNVRNFSYDGLGRRLAAEDLHAPSDTTYGIWTYAYDETGNIVQTVNPNGQTRNYSYNDVNQVISEDYAGGAGTEILYTYGGCTKGIGKLCTVTMTSGADIAYSYDANGDVANETKTISGTAYSTSYGRDRQGNLVLITYPDNAQVRYTFNAAGLLEKIEAKESGGAFTNVVSNFDYSPADAVTLQADANMATTTNTYDPASLYRLTRRLTQNASGLKLQDLNYSYDPVGNITRIIDTSDTPSAKTATYTYDDLHRLTSATVTNAAAGANYAESFSYDALGNITSGPAGNYLYQGNTGSLTANPHAATSINLVAHTYDRNGNLLSNGTLTNTWNSKNQLVQTVTPLATVSYSYDHNGDRICYTKGATTTYYPNKLYSAEGNTKTKQIYAGDQLVATVETTGSTVASFHVHTDHLGSINTVSDNSGDLAHTLDYYAFGAQRISSGIYDEQRQYIGQVYDADTHLNYLMARYYHAGLGKFLSEDPVHISLGDLGQFVQLTGRDVQAYLSDPQQLNSYSYARSNPVAFSDRSGKILDTLLDAGFILYDLGCLTYHSLRGQDTREDVMALGLDAAGALIPFATGFGTMGRAAAHGEDALRAGKASDVARLGIRPIVDENAVSRGKIVRTGQRDLTPEVGDIISGDLKSRGTFRNDRGLLPSKSPGYYKEFEVRTPGLNQTGPERIIRGGKGELYYSGDHYRSFVDLKTGTKIKQTH